MDVFVWMPAVMCDLVSFPCSLFRASSGRSYLRPLGFLNIKWVQDANVMVSRVVLLLLLVVAQQSTFVLEQPRGSLMRRHPRYIWLCKKLQGLLTPVVDLQINLGNSFAKTLKPLTLSSNNMCFLQHLFDNRPLKFFQRPHSILFICLAAVMAVRKCE